METHERFLAYTPTLSRFVPAINLGQVTVTDDGFITSVRGGTVARTMSKHPPQRLHRSAAPAAKAA